VRWLFARHAESTANAAGLAVGRAEAPLTERGRAQAVALAASLRDEPLTRVLCSPQPRAVQTLAGMDRAPTWFVPALRERSLGAWEGRSLAALRDDSEWETRALSWWGAPPRGEALADVAARAVEALSARTDAPSTLVVAHAGVLRVVLGLLDELPFEAIGRLRVPHAVAQLRDVDVTRWERVQQRLSAEAARWAARPRTQ